MSSTTVSVPWIFQWDPLLSVTRHHGYVKCPLNFFQITVKLSADFPFMFCRNVYDCLNDAHLMSESPPDLPGWGSFS